MPEPLIYELSSPGRQGVTLPAPDVPPAALPAELMRGELPLPEVAEIDVVRHFVRLSQLNHAVDTGFYPLGSCTMKYNPKVNEDVARLPGFAFTHPLQDPETVQGNLALMYMLQEWLKEIGGFAGVSLQPAAGAHGRIARFHGDAARCPEDAPWGTPEAVYAPMVQNFSQIRSRRASDRPFLDRLADWTEQRQIELRQVLDARRAGGHVRECHGDLHLGNIALIDGEPVAFDGIEFNPGLRWIDTMNDLAFLTMDLTRVGRVDLARCLLDSYLQLSGDYEGLRVLHFYEVYRAMVRAKVAAIRVAQRDLAPADREHAIAEFRRYLRIAEAFTRPSPTAIVITHGVSGTGKSTLTSRMLDRLPAVRVRSDVERKRLAGLPADVNAMNRYNAGIYAAGMSERTYERLAGQARAIVEGGFIAIVDAAFLKHEQRLRFADLAAALNVPFVILSCEAPETVLRARIGQRLAKGQDASDADLAVLAGQLRDREPLGREELGMSIVITPERPFVLDQLVRRIQR